MRRFAGTFSDPGLPWLFAEGFVLLGAFVTIYNYIGYRLMAPPYGLSQSAVGLLFSVYLVGTFSSTFIGHLAGRLGRRRVLWTMFVVMLAGLALTMAGSLTLIIAGIAVITFGFFGGHSIVSSWVGRRAGNAKAQASSMYLFAYYLGSSLAGAAGGLFYAAHGWTGVASFVATLFALGLSGLVAAVLPGAARRGAGGGNRGAPASLSLELGKILRPAGRRAVDAQPRIVFQCADVLARRRGHGMRLELEPFEAVLRAHAVDLQRPVVVAGEGPSGHEVATPPPAAGRATFGQPRDPAALAGDFRDQTHDLAQGVDLRTAELVGLAAGGAAAQTAQHGVDDIVDEHRLEARIRAGRAAARPAPSRAGRANRLRKVSPGPNITEGWKMVQSSAPPCSRINFSASPFERR